MCATNIPGNERSLVIRLIAGDEDAFCELYAAYKNRLIYFAMRFLKSREYAEDIFQDAFTTIWESRRFINPNTSFSSYLYTIMRNRILNALRHLENEQELKSSIYNQAVDTYQNAEENAVTKDFMEQIAKAMEKLTSRQREIFDMSRNREMSHKEIAQALGISVNTVQEHISSALKTIRAHFGNNSSTYIDLLLLLFILQS